MERRGHDDRVADAARAAIAFLCAAFGFEEHAVHEDGGVVAHAELKLGDAYIMLGQAREESRERVPPRGTPPATCGGSAPTRRRADRLRASTQVRYLRRRPQRADLCAN